MAVYDKYDRGDKGATPTQCDHHPMDARPPEGRGGRRLGQGSSRERYRLGTETLPLWDKPGFHVQEDHGGQIEKHGEVDRHPREARAPVQAPQWQEYATGREVRNEGSHGPVFNSCLDRRRSEPTYVTGSTGLGQTSAGGAVVASCSGPTVDPRMARLPFLDIHGFRGWPCLPH